MVRPSLAEIRNIPPSRVSYFVSLFPADTGRRAYCGIFPRSKAATAASFRTLPEISMGRVLPGAAPCPVLHNETPGCGTVFELSPTSSGQWKRTQLYAFTGGADGAIPEATLTFDAAGNLYGTTGWGGDVNVCDGTFGCGVVFKLSPSSSGAWTETVLHT